MSHKICNNCKKIFFDTDRNGKREYCCPKCRDAANRNKRRTFINLINEDKINMLKGVNRNGF